MKLKLFLLSLFISANSLAQSNRDILLEQDVFDLVEELEFMYAYDQALREYTIYKTFNKSATDSIEKLPDSLRMKVISNRQFKSDSINKFIWRNYINPKDAAHTERMVAIIKKYGFPSVDRIKQYYPGAFKDREFDPIILLIHSPKKYWEELEKLMLKEYKNGIINQCQYGYLLWQFTGRKSLQPMLDNGFKMITENGKTTLKSTCE